MADFKYGGITNRFTNEKYNPQILQRPINPKHLINTSSDNFSSD